MASSPISRTLQGIVRVMDADILNAALEMRLSRDDAVNERLQGLYPHLSEEEADQYRRECGLAMRYGVEVAEKIRLKELLPGQTGEALLLERFPWLRPENLSRLLTHSINSDRYTAWRNGFIPLIHWKRLGIWALWFAVFVFALFCLAWWL